MNNFKDKKQVRKRRQVSHANPLFEKWLNEWKQEAETRGSKMKYNFQKAIRSLQRYPLPLQSGKDCLLLANFGSKICDMIDKKLEEHGSDMQPIKKHACNNEPIKHGSNYQPIILEEALKKGKSIDKGYIPSPKSGAYALLISLYKETKNQDQRNFLKKEELIEVAQEFCDASFTVPKEGSYYTAWSSMSTLIKKNLIEKEGSPSRYYLTAEGKSLAALLLASDSLPTPSASQSENCSENIFPSKSWTENYEGINEDTDIISIEDEERLHGKCPLQGNTMRHGTKRKFTEVTEPSSLLQTEFTEVSSENILFTLKPGTYSVVLNVDNSEVFGGSLAGKKSTKDIITKELKKNGVNFQIRKLNVGDFLWTCQGMDENREVREVVLPFVVERKRMDDLGQSIRDGRFKEQKFRLKQSGLSRPIYLVEEYGSSHSIMPLSTCEQAISNTQVIDNFTVKITSDQKESAAYLIIMTRYLEDKIKGKKLQCVPRSSEYLARDISSKVLYLQDFSEVNSSVAKNRPMRLQEMFAKHLLQINGASVDKVSAIVEKYQTPYKLIKALEQKSDVSRDNLLCTLKCPKSGRNIDQTLSAQIARLYTWENLL